MMRLAVLLLCGALCGCGVAPAVWVAASGGILAGTAAVTNADVNAAEAYCHMRGGCLGETGPAPVAAK